MNVAWGKHLGDQTKGLDVIGIRALDQNIEASLTNGITTISIRARYIPILAWAIGQYFIDESADGRVRHDKEKRAIYLNRVRFLVLAATFLDDTASRAGAMGSDLFSAQMASLCAGNGVRLPDGGSLALLGTYFGPASALGIVETRPESSGLPFGLTARGTAIYRERSMALESTGLVQLLREGGELEYEAARGAIPAFSLSRTGDFASEAELLRKAFEEPWVPGTTFAAKRVAEAYERMAGTRAWINRELENAPAGANQLIARTYDRAVVSGAAGIELEWASFEWHRRVHFALELLLSAITQTLMGRGSLSITEVVETWTSYSEPEAPLSKHWLAPVETALTEIEPNPFAGGVLRPADFSGSPEVVALKAFELLAVQARDARAIGITPGGQPGVTATAARAIQLLEDGTGTLAEVMLTICDECVAQRHIQNTMRKMGNQQDCSLRFYPDGPVLVPTEIDFSPGYSGSRLLNTMRILFDVGLLNIGANAAVVAGIGVR
ncbi:hypothetical protein HFO09_30435 [Rhizobium laguerreae]|uniref:hypothetical protein n=1 Tax=Rhizobium laguerreae TaxID=1076926 RepID=UPI001C9271B2|nr:hypothetical protein [Rhizobium laguerreae]MBY3258834.1 hypothetical protein [Rhizobium laguerreae]MBY3282025.1 hypothetical protein [Rhizobium laguerreae]MBY3293315.1 hypothetical protein [Rhizobium laguerreae]